MGRTLRPKNLLSIFLNSTNLQIRFSRVYRSKVNWSTPSLRSFKFLFNEIVQFHLILISPIYTMRHFRSISTRFLISSICRLNPPPPNLNPAIRLVGSRYTDYRCETALNLVREYNTAAAEEKKKVLQEPTKKVVEIVDELSELTLLEVSDLTELLRKQLNIEEMPAMAMMMPGMGFSVKGGKGGSGGGGKVEEEAKKKEKTAYDLKLDGFDAAGKIKIIKEVRTFTDLGLKEAKELVEKAPIVLKRGVAKEEAEKIIAKMKEVGAKVSIE